jgi:hypothetical protein
VAGLRDETRLRALLIGAAVSMLALLLIDVLIPGFDWIGW